jgi:peroxiredoxin
MRKIYSLIAAAAMLSLGLAAHSLAAGNRSGVAVGSKAPDFTLQNTQGSNVSLHDYSGKIVVLEWTNPNCPFVQRVYHEKTMLNTYDQHKSQGVVWLAINSTHTATNKDNSQWASAQSIPYSILNDSAGKAGKEYHATNTPEMFIIGKDGTVLYKGAIDNDPDGSKTVGKINYVQQALAEIAAGKPVTDSETQPYGCSIKYVD